MAEPGSALPGGFVLGALSHADRVGVIYEARGPGGQVATAYALHPLHVDELRDWFEANAALGLSLRHPNLVTVYAAGETHNGLPVMITERIAGRTLRARIAAADLLMGAEFQRLVRALASALDHLHGLSPPVLHRAIMPEHVVTTPDGGLKLLAVGYADRPHHGAAKPSYLSPEEICGQRLSPASDVFSLASLAFEVLTGRPAFPGDAGAVLAAVQRGALPWVGAAASEALAPLNRVLHRAWSPDPRDRPSRAGGLASEIDEALRLVPAALLAVRRSPSEPNAARMMSSQRALRAATLPSGMPRPVSAPAHASSASSMPTFRAASVAPSPRASSASASGTYAALGHTTGAFAVPPPPRVPSGLTALESPAEAGTAPSEAPRPRSVTPPQAPPPDDIPARLFVDTDDAVLIMEPSLIDDRAVLEAIEREPPPEPVNPITAEAVTRDEPGRLQVIQKRVVLKAPPPPDAVADPPAPALALAPRATTGVRPAAFDRAPTALADPDERRPSWSRWRPRSAPPPAASWNEREIRFTPRLLALIVLGNVALTALIVWGVVALTRR